MNSVFSAQFKIGDIIIGYNDKDVQEEYIFNGERFITLVKYRKLKLEKIKSKLK